MVNSVKTMSALSLLLVIGSCRNDDFDVPLDNHQQTRRLIEVFEQTLQVFFANPDRNGEEIGDFFIRASQEQGLKMVDIEAADSYVTISENAFPYLNAIKTASNGTNLEDYKQRLSNLEKEAIASGLSTGEKQYLAENIRFMVAICRMDGNA